jgi:hypothetical protein
MSQDASTHEPPINALQLAVIKKAIVFLLWMFQVCSQLAAPFSTYHCPSIMKLGEPGEIDADTIADSFSINPIENINKNYQCYRYFE